MKALSRRNVCLALSLFVRMTTAKTAQASPLPEEPKSGTATLLDSQVFSSERIPVTTGENGAKRWDIFHGVLATGEAIALHESLQPANIKPTPPHAIQHSELILVQEGTLLFEHEGRSEKLGAGGVIFVAFGTMHSARNVGDGPAKYLVIAIGGDTQ